MNGILTLQLTKSNFCICNLKDQDTCSKTISSLEKSYDCQEVFRNLNFTVMLQKFVFNLARLITESSSQFVTEKIASVEVFTIHRKVNGTFIEL